MSAPILAIANRAEIAARIARTARACGWGPVALLGEPDWDGYTARAIGNVVQLERGAEFDIEAVIDAANQVGATALHPGYGFLSERAGLSQACRDAGITFIGPSPETLALAGDKIATRATAIDLGVPVVPGSEALDLDDAASWLEVAEQIGYPVIAKVAGAGGGRGLRVAAHADELESAIRSALNEAGGSGAAAELFLEHYLEGARHVEVQVAGDGSRAIVLGDRDCSLQRRHQKVVEEAPAPGLPDSLRTEIHAAARTMAEGISLLNLATIEFLVGGDGRFFFMEINPRLQVEHTVTEEVTGLDLVALQLELAQGGALPEPPPTNGHAIQARLYAEDPFQQFLPSPGLITALEFPASTGQPGAALRVDTGYATGDRVPDAYDPMIAKIIVHAPNRERAITALDSSLGHLAVAGVATNRPWLVAALAPGGDFRANSHDLTTAGAIALEFAPPPESLLRDLIERTHASQTTAWGSVGPFRIVSPATATFHGLESGGWQATATLPISGDADFRIAPCIVPVGAGWEVVTANGRWLVEPGPLPSSGAAAAGDGDIRAPMPGKVLQVLVEAGQQVADGDVVAVLEAMKIEMSLAAPFAGVVTAVSAAEGDLVGLRQIVVSIEPVANEGDAE